MNNNCDGNPNLDQITVVVVVSCSLCATDGRQCLRRPLWRLSVKQERPLGSLLPPAAAPTSSSIHPPHRVAHTFLYSSGTSACVFGAYASESLGARCLSPSPLEHRCVNHAARVGWVPRLEPDEEAPIVRVDYANQPASHPSCKGVTQSRMQAKITRHARCGGGWWVFKPCHFFPEKNNGECIMHEPPRPYLRSPLQLDQNNEEEYRLLEELL